MHTHPSGHVTVIIPTFNRAHTLVRALDSILNQTRAPEQIIVVDDGSTDHTGKLIREQFPQVDYIYQPNQGVSTARNTGIRLASNQQDNAWIALLDSDDEWLPEKLEKQLAAWQRHRQHRLIHSDEIWIRRGRRVNAMNKHRKWGGHIFQHCLPRCIISPSAVLLQRSLLHQTGLFDESLPVCEDYDLWLRICHREAVLMVDEPLIIKYGGHHDQLSRKLWGMDRFRIQALQHCLEQETLGAADRRACINMLLLKLDILIQGATKRGRRADITYYQQLRRQYAGIEATIDTARLVP